MQIQTNRAVQQWRARRGNISQVQKSSYKSCKNCRGIQENFLKNSWNIQNSSKFFIQNNLKQDSKQSCKKTGKYNNFRTNSKNENIQKTSFETTWMKIQTHRAMQKWMNSKGNISQFQKVETFKHHIQNKAKQDLQKWRRNTEDYRKIYLKKSWNIQNSSFKTMWGKIRTNLAITQENTGKYNQFFD